MKSYELHVIGTVYEKYLVDAESEEQAREMFANGDVTETVVSEVENAEIQRVVEFGQEAER